MIFKSYLFLIGIEVVMCAPQTFHTENFRVGVEYTKSLPMEGGSDRYRHTNNYEPFFVTITTTAKKNYVITYLDVTATVDLTGEVDFRVVRGQTGSRTMMFQLVSNHSDFLDFSYLAYGIREDEYRKLTNMITIPMPSDGWRIKNNSLTILFTFCTILLLL